MTPETGHELIDLLESEKKIAQMCLGALQRRYASETNMADNAVQQRFIREAKGLYAENGLVVTVEVGMDVSDEDGDNTVYIIPDIKVVGRVDRLTGFDHDQQRREVRAGVFDGVTGVIDPVTGERKDDPKTVIS